MTPSAIAMFTDAVQPSIFDAILCASSGLHGIQRRAALTFDDRPVHLLPTRPGVERPEDFGRHEGWADSQAYRSRVSLRNPLGLSARANQGKTEQADTRQGQRSWFRHGLATTTVITATTRNHKMIG
jgi:hypothetical protein